MIGKVHREKILVVHIQLAAVQKSSLCNHQRCYQRESHSDKFVTPIATLATKSSKIILAIMERS